jgi:hypothetical protein
MPPDLSTTAGSAIDLLLRIGWWTTSLGKAALWPELTGTNPEIAT